MTKTTKTSIDKKTLEYLAELSRIEIDEKQEEKLAGDLQKILAHFEELKEVDTEGVEPMAGGTIERNVFREDKAEERGEGKEERKRLIDAFPEKEGEFLKTPPIFE